MQQKSDLKESSAIRTRPSLSLPCALTFWLLAFAVTVADPSQTNLDPAQKHWAFQPVTTPSVPPVQRSNWVQTPIDAFILAQLEANQLSPAPPADKRTLLRRATFDLTGLPPTPEELDAFTNDSHPDAFARVIDRLLNSPHYGERWGRHWLDVARYADSNGLDENVAHGNAWRYRDAVVQAFNAGKPFDRFIIEQIAGDLLPALSLSDRQEKLVATAFLSLGAKVLAEPDPQKMEMDIIDEQIDTLGRAFMGLTLGCARCHDHKFDPVPTADYYALAAIFKSTRTMNHFKIVAEWHEPSLATPQELASREVHDKKISAAKDEINTLTSQANKSLRAQARSQAAEYLAAAALLPAGAPSAEIEQVALKAGLRPAILKTCREFLARDTTNTVFKRWHDAVQNQNADAPRIKEYYQSLFEKADQTSAPPAASSAGPASPPPDIELAAARLALEDPKGFLALPPKPEELYPPQTLEKLKHLRDQLSALEKSAPELPATMGVTDSTNICQSLAVHVRGSHLNLGQPVPRGFPSALRRTTAPAQLDEKQSGRLELARWLASPDHPLTARVMVNRIWRWHFGQGLVISTENFGLLGDRPSHPELLDWLAARFVRDNWSIKTMHRLIMNSAVYQQSTTVPNSYAARPQDPAPSRASAPTADPQNRLLSHFSVRRLEAEEIRDALLAVSDSLDRSMGGKTLPLKNREFVFNHTSKDATTYDSHRRALYLPIIRNHLYDLFEQFNYPDPAVPTGSRDETVIAPQALLMMNSDLIGQVSEQMARVLLAGPARSNQHRVTSAYLKAYARHPTALETERALQFLENFDADSSKTAQSSADFSVQAWAALCQAVLAANEFCYLN